jgi:hypothetical protein
LVSEKKGKRYITSWINWSGYKSIRSMKESGYILWAIQETPIIPEGNL